jgi:ribosomal protein L35
LPAGEGGEGGGIAAAFNKRTVLFISFELLQHVSGLPALCCRSFWKRIGQIFVAATSASSGVQQSQLCRRSQHFIDPRFVIVAALHLQLSIICFMPPNPLRVQRQCERAPQTLLFSTFLTPNKVQTKLKPKKSAVKRFKVTATGKLLHSRSGKQHLAVKKSGVFNGRLQRHCICLGLLCFFIFLHLQSFQLQATTSRLCLAKRSSGGHHNFFAPRCHRHLLPPPPSFIFSWHSTGTHLACSDADATNIKRLLSLR